MYRVVARHSQNAFAVGLLGAGFTETIQNSKEHQVKSETGHSHILLNN